MSRTVIKIVVLTFAVPAMTALLYLTGLRPALLFSKQHSPAIVSDVAQAGELRLRISLDKTSFKVGVITAVIAVITNKSSREITLVQPGDGSESGWRTPITHWHLAREINSTGDLEPVEQGTIARCGNINALTAGEVFTLKPGDGRTMTDWIVAPRIEKPGRYRAALEYENDPSREWSGLVMGEHDDGAMKRLRLSTKCSVKSNVVEFTVTR